MWSAGADCCGGGGRGVDSRRLRALEGILRRINTGWRYALPREPLRATGIERGVWFRFLDGTGKWVAPRPNGVQLEEMTEDQQVAIYGEIVRREQ